MKFSFMFRELVKENQLFLRSHFFLIFISIIIVHLSSDKAESIEYEILYEKESLYHHIMVYEDGPFRTLDFTKYIKNNCQSRIDLTNLDTHVLEYTSLVFSGLLINDSPKKILIVGLGGAIIPREMRKYFPDAEIDIVEIDPEVEKIAREYFFFKTDDKMKVNILDARVFVRRQAAEKIPPKYDMIILDAFNSEYIPFHLTTIEFMQDLKSILDPKGVVIANIFYDNKLFDAECQTFNKVFGECYTFFGKHTTNAMVLAPGEDIPALTADNILEKSKKLQEKHDLSFDLISIAQEYFPYFKPDPDAKVLTDDRAPVNVLRNTPR